MIPEIDVATIFEHVLRARLHIVLGLITMWVVIGAFVGVVLSIALYRLFNGRRAFRLRWKRATWARVLVIFWFLAAGILLGGTFGLLEGGLRGARRVVEESQFRSEVLDPAGRNAARATAIFHGILERAEADPGGPLELTEEQDVFVEAFAAGEKELDIVAFLGRLEKIEAEVVDRLVDAVMVSLRKRVDIDANGFAERILRYVLTEITEYSVRKKAGETLEKFGLAKVFTDFLETLPDVAAEEGDSNRIAHSELSSQFVEKAFVPTILVPIRAFVRGKQLVVALLYLAAVFLAVGVFWGIRLGEAKWGEGPTEPVAEKEAGAARE